MTLWTAGELVTATSGHAIGNWTVSGVSIDSRTLQTGDLFVALSAKRDGHAFVGDALQQGAGAALVSHIPEGIARTQPFLLVKDVHVALEAIGRAARARSTSKVLAVTGSVGKTSTKEMLVQILGDQGHAHASVASYNNHWGVPLTLSRMPRDTQFAIYEIGMNHPGEIEPLARMVRPHVAVITTVGAAHLENFDSEHGIAIEKASILDGLEQNGAAILNADSSFVDVLRAKARSVGAHIVDFGIHGQDFCLLNIHPKEEMIVVEAMHADRTFFFKLNTLGVHFATNALAALAAAYEAGADLALAIQTLGRWSPGSGRGSCETIRLDPVDLTATLTLIDDSYNANPTSMSSALNLLISPFPRGESRMPEENLGRIYNSGHSEDCDQSEPQRRVAILGDMFELGSRASELHRELAQHPALAAIDVVHCVGPLMAELYDVLPASKRGLCTPDSQGLAALIASVLEVQDIVLVKGSFAMELGHVVKAIRALGVVYGQD